MTGISPPKLDPVPVLVTFIGAIYINLSHSDSNIQAVLLVLSILSQLSLKLVIHSLDKWSLKFFVLLEEKQAPS